MSRYPLPIALTFAAICCAWYARRRGARSSGVLSATLVTLAALDLLQLLTLPHWLAVALYAARIVLLPLCAVVALTGASEVVAGVLGLLALGAISKQANPPWLALDMVATVVCLGAFAWWLRKAERKSPPAAISLVVLIIADAVSAIIMGAAYWDVSMWLVRGGIFTYAALIAGVVHLGALRWNR